MPAKKKAPELEASLAELEAIVTRMEAGELTLEESLKAFEQGIALTRECQARLTQAEQQVTRLLERDGALALEPFDAPDDQDD